MIEGDNKAVLYTGDIRSEPWWVNCIARNPSLVEYSMGLKTLDRMYLDTSMLSDYVLQTKSEGLRELLSKVAEYPDDTVFCMQAWTYGYEEVWIALSKVLKSKVCIEPGGVSSIIPTNLQQIHVDSYKMRVYKSLVAKSSTGGSAGHLHYAKEAPYLVGFNCGNKWIDGCLTLDQNSRIHSCEKGTACLVMENSPIVWLQPIVTHLPNGQDVTEVGVGGGGDDLEQEVDLAQLTTENIQPLIRMIFESRDLSTEVKEQMKNLLLVLVTGGHPQSKSTIDDFSEDLQTRLGSIIWPMVRSIGARQDQDQDQDHLTAKSRAQAAAKSLPNRICFPYARHSSLPELQHLVGTFRPRDIWPNTFDLHYWEERGIRIRKLFGDYCSGDRFEHDLLMDELVKERGKTHKILQGQVDGETQHTASSGHLRSNPVLSRPQTPEPKLTCSTDGANTGAPLLHHQSSQHTLAGIEVISIASSDSSLEPERNGLALPMKRNFDEFHLDHDDEHESADDLQDDSQMSVLTARAYEARRHAYRSAIDNTRGTGWRPIRLLSTSDHHSELEEELGHI